jgi:Ca2+-binding RTX toxin-like protein
MVTEMFLRLPLLALLACAALTGTADAATLTLDGSTHRYTAAPGEGNAPSVARSSVSYYEQLFSETSAPITVLEGCVSGEPIVCTRGPWIVDLGDRDDRADIIPFSTDSTVYGGPGNDDFASNGGQAWGYGGSGNDKILLGADAGTYGWGGPGRDTVTSGAPGVFLYGEDNDDYLAATSGHSLGILDGGGGDDTIVTAPTSQAQASGGVGDDVIITSPTSVGVTGGPGNDRITSGSNVEAGPGADRIDISSGGSITSCGAGRDTVYVPAADTAVPRDCEVVSVGAPAQAASTSDALARFGALQTEAARRMQ